VPASYIQSEALKIDLHRRLALTEDEDELRELQASVEDRYGPVPEPVISLFQIQEAKLKLARLGADYLVFRAGRASVGPLVLGSAELRHLKDEIGTAVYASGKREMTLRTEEFTKAVELVDAILAARQAA
jgi:transcription-repair coupling factor (superfamily II helicase)